MRSQKLKESRPEKLLQSSNNKQARTHTHTQMSRYTTFFAAAVLLALLAAPAAQAAVPRRKLAAAAPAHSKSKSKGKSGPPGRSRRCVQRRGLRVLSVICYPSMGTRCMNALGQLVTPRHTSPASSLAHAPPRQPQNLPRPSFFEQCQTHQRPAGPQRSRRAPGRSRGAGQSRGAGRCRGAGQSRRAGC